MGFQRSAVQTIADDIRADDAFRKYACTVNVPAANISQAVFLRIHGEAQKTGFRRPIFASALLEVAQELANDVFINWIPPRQAARKGFGLKVTPALADLLLRASVGRFSRPKLVVAMLQHALDELQ